MNKRMIAMYGVIILIFFMVGCINPPEAKGGKPVENKKDKMVKIYNYQLKAYEQKEFISKTPEEWKKKLTDEQFHILRKNGTERPYSSSLNKNKKKGVYKSAASGVALFHSDHKFESGTGWPSFYDVVDKANVELREDNTLFMKRVEIIDKISGSHIGHVFEDGPPPTGLRYCINGDALIFEEE